MNYNIYFTYQHDIDSQLQLVFHQFVFLVKEVVQFHQFDLIIVLQSHLSHLDPKHNLQDFPRTV